MHEYHPSRRRKRWNNVCHLLIICLAAGSCLDALAFSHPSSLASNPRQQRNHASKPSRLHIGYYSGTGESEWGIAEEDYNQQNILNHLGSKSPPLPRGFSYDEEYDDPEISGTLIADSSHHTACVPEVNKWTTLMTDGTNAAIHRPGKEMTLEEGMEILYNDLKDLSGYDNTMIESYWDRLMPTVSYLGTSNAAKVKQALRVAYRAHRSQMRKSGEPFIIHPVEVALLLSGMKMDAETVMAGLLHDTVEDTDLTFEQVEAMFGREVKNIVEGETKVSKLPKLAFAEYADEQAENLRQMFIAMTDDYRIIIVKVSHRVWLRLRL
jgi:hypothetical protein